MRFVHKKKDNILLYKYVSGSPRINLYLYSGNYGEDMNHFPKYGLVGSY